MREEEIKIDMKNKIVTIGKVTIDMDGGIITIGTSGVRVDENAMESEDSSVEPTKPKPVVHRSLSAKQKAKFKAERENLEGSKVVIDDVKCIVSKHIKGTLYEVKASIQRPSNSGGLPTSVNVNRFASHNKGKDIWSWWVDQGGKLQEYNPNMATAEEGHSKDTPKNCSRCGMVGTNIATCESILSTDGTWLQVHRPTLYKEGRDNA